MSLDSQQFNYVGLKSSLITLENSIQKLKDILGIAKHGMNIAKMLPKIQDFLARVAKSDIGDEFELNEEDEEDRTDGIKLANIAEKEIEDGFPFLHSQAVVMFYSYLETAVKDLVIGFLRINNLSEIREFQNVKISIADYISLSDNERYEYLFSQFEKTNAIGIQYGTTRFESILKPIKLSGFVPDVVARNIFEISQVRNNILHKSGVVDRQLVKSCPWLGYNIGDQVKISLTDYRKYYKAIMQYFIILGRRLMIKEGLDLSIHNTMFIELDLHELIDPTLE